MGEWFSVDELLPENCKLCNFHSDSTMEFTSVLTMNKRGQMEIKNRIRVKKSEFRVLMSMQLTDGCGAGAG